MYRPRTIDDLLADPQFSESENYRALQEIAEQAGYPSVKEVLMVLLSGQEESKREDRERFSAEVMAAVEAEKEDKKFPPMVSVAACLRARDFHGVPDEGWNLLADFVEGKHRGARGRKHDAEASRERDKRIAVLYEKCLDDGMKAEAAYDHVSKALELFIEPRGFQEAVRRGRAHMAEEIEAELLCEKLKGLQPMTDFFDET